MAKKVVNIINFIRGCEPRLEMDLYTPVKKQIEYIKKYNLKSTFLFQYDALLREDIIELFNSDVLENTEVGCWLEIVSQQTENIGITYPGRKGYSWDYYSNAGSVTGYTQPVRKALIDEYMKKFYKVFGIYPESVGAWAIDAESMKYLSEKYHIKAFCICRDQVGTDGYNLIGGYYSGGYYPSINNMLCPASNIKTQINTPVFRMLGSCPLEQYDAGLDQQGNPMVMQGVVTLEPVCINSDNSGGGSNQWVDWFFENNFYNNLNFSYAQVGQENSFGWERMKNSLLYQFDRIYNDLKDNKIEVKTMAETGKWFIKEYKETPATTVVVKKGYINKADGSIWYNSKAYRVNFVIRNKVCYIRDMYLFNDGYKEKYIDEISPDKDLIFDNLPVMNGYLYSGNGIFAGVYLTDGNSNIEIESWEYTNIDSESVEIILHTVSGNIAINVCRTGIKLKSTFDFCLEWKVNNFPDLVKATDHKIELKHNDFSYSIAIGALKKENDNLKYYSDKKSIEIKI